MRKRGRWLPGLIVLVGTFLGARGDALRAKTPTAPAPPAFPLEGLPPEKQAAVRQVMEKTTLVAQGPRESFSCRPEHYYYFLDHPDRAVVAWRKLGAKCVSISDLGNGQFGWADENGSEVTWETVHRDAGRRVWYAEGKVRPGPKLPFVPVRVVLVLRHNEGRAPNGSPVIDHQSDLYLFTDSRAAALVTRLLGPSTGQLATQGLGQFQLFFSLLTWYMERHPEYAGELLGRSE